MNYNEWTVENPTGTPRQYVEYCHENGLRPDLRGADLCGADLCGADLRGAYLSVANLGEADLCGASGPFTVGYFGRHHAVAAGGYISIGCERHTYDHWLENYEAIGVEHEYTDDERADYGAWIKLAVTRQLRIEAGQ